MDTSPFFLRGVKMQNYSNRSFNNNQYKIDFDKIDFNKIVRIMRAFCNFLEEISPLSDKKEGVENGDN